MSEPDDTEAQMDIEDIQANGADDAAIDLQKQRAKRQSERVSDFYRSLLASKESRHEFFTILEEAGVFRAPFVASNGFPDNNATWFQAGKYAFAQGLYHKALAVDLDGTRKMLIEHDPDFKALAPEMKRRGAHA